MKEKEKNSTTIGKIFTLLCFIYIFISFSNSDLIQRTNPLIYIRDTKIDKRPSFNFSKQELSFVIGISDENNNFELRDDIFQIKSQIIFSHSAMNISTKLDIDLKICDETDFENESTFGSLNLNSTLCLPNGSYNLRGFWDEIEVQYITFEILFCKNTTENQNFCSPQEEIEHYFLEKDRFLSFYINDMNIDASNPSRRPFTKKLNTLFFLIDINLRKSYELYFKETTLVTTEGFVFQETFIDKTFQFDSFQTDINTLNKDSKNIAFIEFYSSNVQTNIDRKYQDLQAAFSNISGILNFMIFIAFLLSNFENNFNIVRELTGNLYVFQNISKLKESKQDSVKTKNESIKSPNVLFRDKKSDSILPKEFKTKKKKTKMINFMGDNNHPPEDSQAKTKTIINKIFGRISENPSFNSTKNSFSLFKKLQKKFEFGFFKYIKMILKFKKIHLSVEEKLFLKAEKELKSEMNIIEILKKLQEIEKLKKILLNSDELYLFELLDKPYIFLQKNELNNKTGKIEFRRCSRMTNHLKEKNFFKNEVHDHYMEVKKAGSAIGQKILKLIDEDVVKFLDENSNNS